MSLRWFHRGVRLQVLEDIKAERERQVEVNRFTPEHDDQYTENQLARAAIAYMHLGLDHEATRLAWPWSEPADYPRPIDKGRRANLVRAAGLIVAELERLERASIAAEQSA